MHIGHAIFVCSVEIRWVWSVLLRYNTPISPANSWIVTATVGVITATCASCEEQDHLGEPPCRCSTLALIMSAYKNILPTHWPTAGHDLWPSVWVWSGSSVSWYLAWILLYSDSNMSLNSRRMEHRTPQTPESERSDRLHRQEKWSRYDA